VHGELQVPRQSVPLGGVGEHRDVVGKLLLEASEITDVVHALVEPARELGGDGLQGHSLVGQQREDHEQLRRRLRRIGFVHAHLDGDPVPPLSADVPEDLPGLAAGEQVAAGHPARRLGGERHRLGDARDHERRGELRMPGEEGGDVGVGGQLADRVGHIDREKVARVEEPVDRLEADVVGVNEPWMRPLPRRDGGARRRPDAGRLAADEAVFAVRLVPDRRHDDAGGGEPFEGGKLGLGLVREPITDAEGESWECEHAERIPAGRAGRYRPAQRKRLLFSAASRLGNGGVSPAAPASPVRGIRRRREDQLPELEVEPAAELEAGLTDRAAAAEAE
jgi:hypothetical protein